MKIPFLDLKQQYQNIKGEISVAINEVLESTAFAGGPFVEKFEKNFAQYCGTKFAVGLSNGTDAIHMAVRALGIGQGDEVIVPANTFIASAWGVSHANATPVFVDCTNDTWTIDVSKIEEKISKKTKAIIGVHLYGQPFDVDEVRKICEKHKLFLIEDCAQAQGAIYKGKRVGGLGEIGCFSFYPGKNLGAYGEAGAVTTNNENLVKLISAHRNQGSYNKYEHDLLGFNMRMDGLQGAILDVKLKHLEKWNSRRKQIAKKYREEIKNPKIKIQLPNSNGESVYHLFVVTTDDREKLKSYLESSNIFPAIHYPIPCHLQKAYSHLNYKKGDFPNSEYLSFHCLSLPMFPELKDEEVNKVIEAVNGY